MPLSEYEERMIAEFERQFDGSDPFESGLRRFASFDDDAHHLGSVRLLQFGTAGTVLGLLIMTLALGISVPVAFAGFLLAFASAYWAAVGISEGGWERLRAGRRRAPRRRSTDR